jgi:putative colanic acid biosynthesis acetyltransferase WcaF
MKIELSTYDNSRFNPGRRFYIRTVWHFVNAICLQNGLFPFSKLKVMILTLFGAKIGKDVVIKPGINVKPGNR